MLLGSFPRFYRGEPVPALCRCVVYLSLVIAKGSTVAIPFLRLESHFPPPLD